MAAKIQPIMPDVGLGSWQDAIEHGLEGTSQTWKVGAPLVVSSGKLIEATTSTSAKSGIIGFALAAATGVANTDTLYVPPSPDVLSFQGTIDGTLSSSNAPGTGQLTQANMYTGGTLQKDAASGLWFFNNTATGDFIFIAAIPPDNPVATVNGRVRVRFLHAICLIA
jgi:hypothetical protein